MFQFFFRYDFEYFLVAFKSYQQFTKFEDSWATLFQSNTVPILQEQSQKVKWITSREDVIMEWPLNGQFHNRRDVILMSQMVVSNIFLTVAII